RRNIGGGARVRPRSPRSEAGEHQINGRRTRESARFRIGESVCPQYSGNESFEFADADVGVDARRDSGYCRLHVPGTGERQERGSPCRIWAFGVVLYEMLTGRMLFSGETTSETIAAVMMKEPDWTALPANTPARLRDLIRRCLVKEPRNRVRDIGDARIAIEEVQSGGEAGGVVPETL